MASQITIDELSIFEVDSDPSIVGQAGPIGSLALLDGGARKWQKFGPLDTDWKEDNVALNVSFNPTSTALVSTDVENAIKELSATAAISASPGFTWGYKGQATPGTYLENDGVPSNVSGRIVPLSSGKITEIFVLNETSTTFSVDIQKRVGATFTTVHTVTVTTSRGNVFTVSVDVVRLEELCVRVSPTTANTPKNIDVGIIIKGTTA